ncbi:hypothetical protein CRUP_027715 [Coryphaenoides rupestris]|nr:hypothetical protein CRUP_027715 [Coryphaenoides rupestris]
MLRESEGGGGGEVDGKKKEQRRRAIEGVVDITKLCLMEMNREDLADALRSERAKTVDLEPRPAVPSEPLD